MSKPMNQIKENAKRNKVQNNEPVWKGPREEGITQSILGGYFVCPERFRLKMIEGLVQPNEFSPAIEYGNMWHECEERHKRKEDWKNPLICYARDLAKKYPYQGEQIEKWYNVCKIQFEIYQEFWEEDNSKNRVPMLQEKEFLVNYTGETWTNIKLKGKWDAVDYWKGDGVYLTENKSKGTIDPEEITNLLSFDLQCGMYLVALRKWIKAVGNVFKEYKKKPISGINYNVVRRPLSGGVGSIRRHKATKTKPEETADHYYGRLKEIIENDPEYFFMRWDVAISDEDIDKFDKECLSPILENLCDDYEWWSYCYKKGVDHFDSKIRSKKFPNQVRRHYRTPYGIWNPISKGIPHALDLYLKTGNNVGLTVCDNFFPELS